MRVKRLATGVVCLGLAGYVGWWAWEHQAYYEKVSKPGQHEVKVADLIAKGPAEGHSVRLMDLEVGEPVVIERGPNEYLDVWFPVYPTRQGRRKGPPAGPPQVLYHTRYSLSSKEAVAFVRKNGNVGGTVMNGLPDADIDIPPEVTQAYPGLDPAKVWYVRGDQVWQEGGIYWAAFGTVILGILGLWLTPTGLFGRPTPKKARETRRLPAVQPLDAKTARQAARGYYHSKCGCNTLAKGDDLVRLECPFRGCSGTYCCGCQKVVPLAAVHWDDTGENVAEYRERIASAVPFWRRAYLFWLGNAYQGAVNLGLDESGRVVQPLRDPPAGRAPVGAAGGPVPSRG